MTDSLLFTRLKAVLFSCVILVLSACSADTEFEEETAKYSLPELVDYNYHIKPILSDTCFLCHGPDTTNAKAGLSLHTFEQATNHILESGSRAIVAGKPNKSEAITRILSDDPNLMMPPPSSNLKLSDREKAMIKRWVKQGAKYKKHWSYITPKKMPPPQVTNNDWPENELDFYILSALEKHKLAPSQEADKETLIRRVSFDLTGLPPSLAEIDDFLADDSENAYEKVIDRLLATTAYGERVATEWLDVARYADTHGYATDPFRDVSPYRDWVIEKFNQNMPFDDFITWQLAGDLLPDATDEQKLATAFNRMHTQNTEGGIVLEEFRVEYVRDRVQAVGTGLLGLTLHCAQCHDHKYDDIPTEHYYQTFAMFNNNDDTGQISWDPNDMPVPTLMLPSSDEKAALTALEEKIKVAEGALSKTIEASEQDFLNWRKNTENVDIFADDALLAHYPFEASDTERKINNALFPKADSYSKTNEKSKHGYVLYGSSKEEKSGDALNLSLDNGNQGILLNGDDALFFPSEDHFNRATPFTVGIKTKLPIELEEAVLFHYNKSSTLYNYKGFDVSIVDNHWLVRFAHTYPFNAIVLSSTAPITKNQWQHVALTYDGSSKAAGVTLFVDGQTVDMKIDRDNLYKTIRHPNTKELGLVTGFKVGARWRDRGAANALVDDLKIWSRELSKIEIKANAKRESKETLSITEVSSQPLLKDFYNKRYNSSYKSALSDLAELRSNHNNLNEPVAEIMIMQELEGEPRQSYILDRGLYSNHGKKVQPGVPEAIFPFDQKLPKNRIGLASWLTDPEHPLVSRVVSNRYWMMMMGTGIVRTPEDFGNQGDLPTHPDALDWLSREFIDSGWDVKHLLKTIAMSATYRQSSLVDDELQTLDPENTFYARGPSSRLTAEMLRDNVLAASGLLIKKIGGKSVFPYQPPGLWRMNRAEYTQSTGDDLYRRSMYTVWKRNAPPPSMHNFDTPTRTYSVGTRQATNTPLQALTMMNDPQYVEAGRVLAERVMADTSTTQEQLKTMYRLLTSKHPDDSELAILNDMFNSFHNRFSSAPEESDKLLSIGEMVPDDRLDKSVVAALTSVANLIINHDATVIKR